jgi:acetylornithine/N-succinyldiaminopimelate aminotransferase
LNHICKKTDAILIVDEVQTGITRTGTFYASEGVGLEPDIITLAKPLAGGLPLSAVLIPEKVHELIHPSDHGTTFGGGPVTTAVALKVWETVCDPGFIPRVRELGECLLKGLEGLKARHATIGAIRGRGLLRGFEYNGGAVQDLLARLQEKGMLALRSGENVVRIAPPLIIKKKEILMGIDIIEEALQ